MANDRLLLGCPACREYVPIYKMYPNGGAIGGGFSTTGSLVRMAMFLAEHLDHHPNARKMTYEGDPFLRLSTESAKGSWANVGSGWRGMQVDDDVAEQARKVLLGEGA